MKKKLELKNLEVKSFITKKENRIKGGTRLDTYNCASNPCENTNTCETFGCGFCTNVGELCIG
ncbi:pinensin family lanthipeptide [Roseivirga sp. BDSF3-8]|uniref:pinensin family lanthipeptide n=1 Tax=Roseivirga sp. BDSF3-8 TaxID=3241598 RepID=UPI003532423B